MARVLKAAVATVAVAAAAAGAAAAESAVGFFSRLQPSAPKLRTFSTSQSSLQAASPVWNLGRLNHVAIAVPDLEKATAFYKNVLGARVDDINAAVMDLKEKKIRSLSEEAKIGAHGKPVIFLHPKDCGGVLVELEQA
ncbi:methylmalonyl-CoA epimerase, mitochondrial isoform X2 [Mustela putorius furo]|uniref:Methylmalonyl-CoA epimerase, mitochondrial isoform X2 n=1 Tax=Mustela putorius furo TaxID=9669 RepID=A0A8U0NV00_MUSPF|nr:methylmalonyl-CoA epimerase, mitochondrial isoform X2 [Mustela putorius furo]